MLKNNHDIYNLQMSAWGGINDYTFSEKALGRSEEDGQYSQQIFIQEGGLKHQTDITAGLWLSSLNAEYNLHKNIRLYT